MGLINDVANKNKPEKNIGSGQTEKPARHVIVPVLILLLALTLLAGLVAGSYWALIHQEELSERFFPSDSDETIQAEDVPDEKPATFLSKLIKKDRTIVVRGTLLGEEGGAAVLINKKVLPKGTQINGVRILEITNQSIVIESNGQKIRLQVGESFDPDEE